MDMDEVSPSHFVDRIGALTEGEAILVADPGDGSPAPGYGVIRRYSDRRGYRFACETSVYVACESWHRGVGSLLQEELLTTARQHGYRHVVAKILTRNHRSIAMHKRFGFEHVGTQRAIGDLDGSREDVTIMQLLLDEPSVIPAPPHLVGRLASLVDALTHRLPQTPAEVASLLGQIALEERDFAPFVSYDHSAADSYGRHLLASGPCFEALVMCWRPGDYSAIHDHGHARWGAVQHFGASEHFTYDHQGDVLVTRRRELLVPGTISSVASTLIHQMGNPTEAPFFSLHVYGGDATDKSITADARVFDLFEQQILRTDAGVFFCLPEAQISSREPGPRGDAETTYRHHRQMLARLDAMAQAGLRNETLMRRRAALRRPLTVG